MKQPAPEKPPFLLRAKRLFRQVFVFLFQHICRNLIVIMYRPRVLYAGPDTRKAVMARPCVFVCNHISPMDASVIHTALRKKRIMSLVALDLYNKPRAHFLWTLLPMHPIDREHASVSWVHDCKQFLSQGRSVLIFPEGHRTPDGAVHEFKPGFTMLAASAKVDVVPIYHNGQYNIVFGKRFRMAVGDPIPIIPAPSGLREAMLLEECDEAYRRVRELERLLTGSCREVSA